MGKNGNTRERPLLILRLLMENSDESHPVSMDEILQMLEKEGIPANRKSVYQDIDSLTSCGYDVVTLKGARFGYYLSSRSFEPAELKLLVDSVQSSRFITTKKTSELIRKIEKSDERAQKFFISDFVKRNRTDVLSPYLLYRYKWAFNLRELRDNYSILSRELNKGYIEKLKEYITMLERTAVGQPYIDFTLNNIDGEAVELSSLVGKSKLVLVDFWASWCPDCRVENPYIVETYNLYKDKGLEIVSVSLDTDKEAWLKGIKDDNLNWENHLSELKGWNCHAAKEYGVAFIPQNFLINDKGIIIAKNVNGENLKLFLSRYLR